MFGEVLVGPSPAGHTFDMEDVGCAPASPWQQPVCRRCGATVMPDDAVCHRCGASIGGRSVSTGRPLATVLSVLAMISIVAAATAVLLRSPDPEQGGARPGASSRAGSRVPSTGRAAPAGTGPSTTVQRVQRVVDGFTDVVDIDLEAEGIVPQTSNVTLALQSGVVAVVTTSDTLIGYRSSDGARLWETRPTVPASASSAATAGAGSDLGVAYDLRPIGTDQFVLIFQAGSFGIDAKSGAQQWFVEGVVDASVSGRAVAMWGRDGLSMIDPDTKTVSWSVPWRFIRDWIGRVGNTVIGIASDRVDGVDATSGRRLWQFPVVTGGTRSAVFAAGDVAALYPGTGEIIGVAPEDGRVLWRRSFGMQARILGASRTQVVVSSVFRYIALDPATGQERWSTPPGSSSGALAMDDRRIVLAGLSGVEVLDAEHGHVTALWRDTMGGGPVSGGNLVCMVTARDGQFEHARLECKAYA